MAPGLVDSARDIGPVRLVTHDAGEGIAPDDLRTLVLDVRGRLGDARAKDNDDHPDYHPGIWLAFGDIGGDGSFAFTSNLPGASFSLTTTNGAASRAFTNLAPATYNINETVPAGWVQSGATCTNGADPANISLAPGVTVRCTTPEMWLRMQTAYDLAQARLHADAIHVQR